MNGVDPKVWRAAIDAGCERRNFDSSSESTWLPALAGYQFPDDPGGEARSKLGAVAALAAWLAMPPSLDPSSLASVDVMLRGVLECRAILCELSGVLGVLHAELGDSDE